MTPVNDNFSLQGVEEDRTSDRFVLPGCVFSVSVLKYS